MNPRDEPDFDPRLRAALRHAPDRDLAPTAAVDQRILEAARASVRARSAPARGGWRAWLDALTRPAGAAALASVVLATVIGVMWRDGPPADEAREVALAPTPAPAATAPRADAAPPAQRSAAAPAQVAAQVAAPAPAAQAAAELRREAAARQRLGEAPAPKNGSNSADERAATSPSPNPPAPAQPALVTAPLAPATVPEPMPVPATVPAPVPAALPAPVHAPPPAPVRSDVAETAQRPRAEAPVAAARGLAVPPPRSPGASMLAAAAFDPMLAALVNVDAGSADAALLRELQRAVGGRWQAVMPPERLPPFSAPPLRLGVPAGALHLEGDSVFWVAPDGTAWHGSLAEGAAPLLRERLARPR